jgi:hypothetical protein
MSVCLNRECLCADDIGIAIRTRRDERGVDHSGVAGPSPRDC